MIARWTNYCRGVPRKPRTLKRDESSTAPLPKPFSQDWEVEWRNLMAEGCRLPYALVVGFWDARTLRRPQR